MRYPPEHKAEIHRKIVKDASRRVRANGITGSAVSAVMRDAGLTHGGFYKHFRSKDELLLESVKAAFGQMEDFLIQAAGKSSPGAAWKTIVKAYLSLEHCDHIESGCPMPALAPELARAGKSIRTRIPAEVLKYRSRMLPYMPGRRKADKARNFIAIFATMTGAIAIARLFPDPAMRAAILTHARNFLVRSF
jgi:TetR/AcrR family transcriptional regulator, transcriptional repressor for nem operon